MATKRKKNPLDNPILIFDSVEDYIKNQSKIESSKKRIGILKPKEVGCVDFAEPFRHGAMHYSHEKPANGMLINQYNYPLFYDKKKDELCSAYSDRAYSWDYDHAQTITKKHLGKTHIDDFFQGEDPKKCLDFLVEFLKAEPEKNWIGWRVLGFVNKSNGFPLYYYSLFAKGSDSDTPVYSSFNAPNVYPRMVIELTRDSSHAHFSYTIGSDWNEEIYIINDD